MLQERKTEREREKDMFLKEIKQKARLKKWGERELTREKSEKDIM